MPPTITDWRWLIAERLCRLKPATPRHQAVQEQDDERADDGRNEARAFAGTVPSHDVTEPSGEQRPGNPEQDGDDTSARVLARHQQLGNGAGKASDDDPANDPVMLHRSPPSFPVI